MHVVIVTSAAIGSNPRVVKEADALQEAGYDVTVIWSALAPNERDHAVLGRARWRERRVDRGSRLLDIVRAVRQRVSTCVLRLFPRGSWRLAAWSLSRHWPRLCNAAAQERGDLYIGHNLAALPAVARAARRNGASFAFDFEDDHVTESGNAKNAVIARQLIDGVIQNACFTTASSAGIAGAVSVRHGVDPLVVRNVFPVTERKGVVEPPRPRTGPWRFYWYSQTVGRDRGLERFITVLGRTGIESLLTLRGECGGATREAMEAAAHESSIRLEFVPHGSPDDMTRLAAEHDVGVCVEQRFPANRNIALANKLFTYALAGLPVVLSDTEAHRSFAEEVGQAALILPDDDLVATELLRVWLGSETAMSARARLIWAAGSDSLCWDREKLGLLALVAAVCPVAAECGASAAIRDED